MKYATTLSLAVLATVILQGMTPAAASSMTYADSMEVDSMEVESEVYHSPNHRISLHAWEIPLEVADDAETESSPFARTRLALFRHSGSGVERLGKFEIDGTLPEETYLSDDGKYIVFVQRYGQGIEIFRSDGSLVRAYQLGDLFTSKDLGYFPIAACSGRQRLDNHRIELDPESSELVFEFTQTALQLRIDLDSGEPTEPKKDLFPYFTAEVSRLPTFDLPADQEWSTTVCPGEQAASFEQTVSMPFGELLERSYAIATPQYTEIASRARISGQVGVEILVSPTGSVECYRLSQELPLGLSWQVSQAVKRWKFQPAPSAGFVRSTFAYDFSIVWHNQTLPTPKQTLATKAQKTGQH